MKVSLRETKSFIEFIRDRATFNYTNIALLTRKTRVFIVVCFMCTVKLRRFILIYQLCKTFAITNKELKCCIETDKQIERL